MKTPAARASSAKITPKPPNEMNADRPVRMSHMANNRKPIFLLKFIKVFFLWDVITNVGLQVYEHD